MRSVLSFLIGCVIGATAILAYLHEKGTATASPAPVRSTAPLQPALKGDLLIPVVGVGASELKSDFGDVRSGGRAHEALDIRAPRGTPVVAVTDGTIRKLFTSKAGGLTIYHYDTAEVHCYYYAHLDRYADGLREGMTVARGDVIGYVGTTGNAPLQTPHLHFGVTILPPTKEWWKGEAIDPFPLLVK